MDKNVIALNEILAETDGRNPSHIGQDRAHAIAKGALLNRDADTEIGLLTILEKIVNASNSPMGACVGEAKICNSFTIEAMEAIEKSKRKITQ